VNEIFPSESKNLTGVTRRSTTSTHDTPAEDDCPTGDEEIIDYPSLELGVAI